MIKIKVFVDNQQDIYGIEVSGHAGFAKNGEDIVCAGVSALTYTMLNSLKSIVGIEPTVKISNGYTKCILPLDIDGEKKTSAQIVLKTIVLGYKNIQESYKSFIEVLIEEV